MEPREGLCENVLVAATIVLVGELCGTSSIGRTVRVTPFQSAAGADIRPTSWDSITMDHALSLAGKLLADSLKRLDRHIVFAESCTAGLASATLAENPGVSAWHHGSAVTYRNATKHEWLKVSWDLLEPPGPGPVSEPVAQGMARGVLNSLAGPQIAAAITGHLGPGVAPEEDGLVWMAVARRLSLVPDDAVEMVTRRVILTALPQEPWSLRVTRQREAARLLLEFTRETLEAWN